MKLNLGCGPHVMKGWENMDLEQSPGVWFHDLRRPLPLQDGCVKYIFSEHFIEHITREEGVRLLKECHRVLAPGGMIRVSTPNLAHIAQLYLTSQIGGWGDWKPATPAVFFNEAMRLWGHQFLYDVPELFEVFMEAGFASIERVDWRKSKHGVLRDLEVRPYMGEVIVEAMKSSR